MCHRCLVVSADKWVYGLAVDPEKDKLYITDYGSKKIVVTSLDGSGERTLLNCTGLPESLVCGSHQTVTFTCNSTIYLHQMHIVLK